MIGHIWVQTARDENEDRVRVLDRCACGAARYGCFAKRADDEGPASVGRHRRLDGDRAVAAAVLVVSASDCSKCGKSLARHPCGRDVELELLTLKNRVQRNEARLVELEFAVELLKTALAGVVA